MLPTKWRRWYYIHFSDKSLKFRKFAFLLNQDHHNNGNYYYAEHFMNIAAVNFGPSKTRWAGSIIPQFYVWEDVE